MRKHYREFHYKRVVVPACKATQTCRVKAGSVCNKAFAQTRIRGEPGLDAHGVGREWDGGVVGGWGDARGGGGSPARRQHEYVCRLKVADLLC